MYEAYRSPTFCFPSRRPLSLAAAQSSMMAAEVLFGLFGQGREGPVVGAVGGDLGLGQPGAVDRAEQIVLGTDGRVEIRLIDAAAQRGRGFALRGNDGEQYQGDRERKQRLHQGLQSGWCAVRWWGGATGIKRSTVASPSKLPGYARAA